MPPLTFIVQSSNKKTAREQALDVSLARAHAAKVAFAQRDARDARDADVIARKGRRDIIKSRLRNSDLSVVVYKGNSDPFSTSRIGVTPRINQVLSFLNDAYVLEIYPGKTSWIVRYTVDNFLSDQARALLSSPMAYCDLLPYMFMLSKLATGGALERDALSVQLQVIQRTRQTTMFSTGDQEDFLTLVRALFMSAVAEHSLDTARSHGIVLSQLLRRKLEDDSAPCLHEGDLHINVLYYALNLAQITLEEPVVDVSIAEPCLRNCMRPITQYLEPFNKHFEQRLDPSLADPALRATFSVIMKTIWLWHHEQQPSPHISQPELARYCCVQHNSESLRLVSYYVQFKTELDDSVSRLTSGGAYLVCQSILALALMAYLATFVCNPKIGSQYVWKKHTKLLSEMKGLLTLKMEDGVDSDGFMHYYEYRNALVFALWVGATWELKEGTIDPDIEVGWFRKRFVRQCRSMALCGWQDVEEVLNGFVLPQYALPAGSSWVDAVLAAGTDGPAVMKG